MSNFKTSSITSVHLSSLLGCVLCALLWPVAAEADGSLNFKAVDTPRIQKMISEKIQAETFLAAGIDLNADNIDEYIVKSKSCVKFSACKFYIFADNGDVLVPLGEIQAYDVRPGDQYSQGVRDLWAYENPDNQFRYKVYAWEPSHIRYMMKE